MLISGSAVKAGEKNLPSANKIPSRSPGPPRLPQAVFLPAGCLFLQKESGMEGGDQPQTGGHGQSWGVACGGVGCPLAGEGSLGGPCLCQHPHQDGERWGCGRVGVVGRWVLLPAPGGDPLVGAALAPVPTSPSRLRVTPHVQWVVASRGGLRSPGYPPLAISHWCRCQHTNEHREAPMALPSVAMLEEDMEGALGAIPCCSSHFSHRSSLCAGLR